MKTISHLKFQSSGTDPKEALDKALFEQMQQMSNKKKEAVRVRKIFSTGTLAACCKPSSGASVVWMETTLERLGLTPSHEEWRPLKVIQLFKLLHQGADQARRMQD